MSHEPEEGRPSQNVASGARKHRIKAPSVEREPPPRLREPNAVAESRPPDSDPRSRDSPWTKQIAKTRRHCSIGHGEAKTQARQPIHFPEGAQDDGCRGQGSDYARGGIEYIHECFINDQQSASVSKSLGFSCKIANRDHPSGGIIGVDHNDHVRRCCSIKAFNLVDLVPLALPSDAVLRVSGAENRNAAWPKPRGDSRPHLCGARHRLEARRP